MEFDNKIQKGWSQCIEEGVLDRIKARTSSVKSNISNNISKIGSSIAGDKEGVKRAEQQKNTPLTKLQDKLDVRGGKVYNFVLNFLNDAYKLSGANDPEKLIYKNLYDIEKNNPIISELIAETMLNEIADSLVEVEVETRGNKTTTAPEEKKRVEHSEIKKRFNDIIDEYMSKSANDKAARINLATEIGKTIKDVVKQKTTPSSTGMPSSR